MLSTRSYHGPLLPKPTPTLSFSLHPLYSNYAKIKLQSFFSSLPLNPMVTHLWLTKVQSNATHCYE